MQRSRWLGSVQRKTQQWRKTECWQEWTESKEKNTGWGTPRSQKQAQGHRHNIQTKVHWDHMAERRLGTLGTQGWMQPGINWEHKAGITEDSGECWGSEAHRLDGTLETLEVMKATKMSLMNAGGTASSAWMHCSNTEQPICYRFKIAPPL